MSGLNLKGKVDILSKFSLLHFPGCLVNKLPNFQHYNYPCHQTRDIGRKFRDFMAYAQSNSKSFMRCPKFYDALSLTIMNKGVHLRITFYSANKAALALNDPNKKQLDKFSKNNSVINFKRICSLFQQDFKDFTKHASLDYWDICLKYVTVLQRIMRISK